MFRQILDILGIGRRATATPTLAVSWNGDDAPRVQTRDKEMRDHSSRWQDIGSSLPGKRKR